MQVIELKHLPMPETKLGRRDSAGRVTEPQTWSVRPETSPVSFAEAERPRRLLPELGQNPKQ